MTSMEVVSALKKAVGLKVGGISEKWRYSSQKTILSGPIIDDIDCDGKNEILFTTEDGFLVCISEDGTKKWEFNSSVTLSDFKLLFLKKEMVNSIYSTPVVFDINDDKKKEILFGSDNGYFFAVSCDGKLLWKYKASGAIRSNPSVDVTGVYFGSDNCFLYCLDFKGKIKFKFKAKSSIESSPLPYGESVYFGDKDGNFYSITQKKLNWIFKTQKEINSKPVIGDLLNDKNYSIIFGSDDGKLYALGLDGKLKFDYTTDGRIMNEIRLADINDDNKLEILFGSADDSIYAIDHNGSTVWSYETNFWVISSPIVADFDNDYQLEVLAGSYDKEFYVLDAKGAYVLDYVPGISGVIPQAGHYSNIITGDPGVLVGKKIWSFKVDSYIIGIGYNKGCAVICTKNGFVYNLKHEVG